MGSLAQSRSFTIAPDPLTEIRSHFTAARADEDETAATVRSVHKEAGYLIDPHTPWRSRWPKRKTATARCDGGPVHRTSGEIPAAVAAASGINPALPDWLGDLNARKERVTVLPADQGAIEKFILAASRAAREGAAA